MISGERSAPNAVFQRPRKRRGQTETRGAGKIPIIESAACCDYHGKLFFMCRLSAGKMLNYCSLYRNIALIVVRMLDKDDKREYNVKCGKTG